MLSVFGVLLVDGVMTGVGMKACFAAIYFVSVIVNCVCTLVLSDF